MSENSERNDLSVKPKPRDKQKLQKKVAKKSEVPKNLNDLSANNNGQVLNNSTTNVIPNVRIPRVRVTRNNELFYEELEGVEKEEVMMQIEKMENVHWIRTNTENCTYNSTIFASPLITDARFMLIPLLSCNWCLRLFNAKRYPRLFYDIGNTVCQECVNESTNSDPANINPTYQFNFAYAHHVHNLLKNCKFFNSDTPVYSELERALFNKCNSSAFTRLICNDLKQRRSQVNEIIIHYKDFVTKSNIRDVIILAAVDEFYDFKQTFQTQDIIEWQKCLIKSSADLCILRQHCSKEEFGNEADWLLWSKRVYLHPSRIITKRILQKLLSNSFEYYAVVRTTKNTICYSKLFTFHSGFIIPAFTSKPPELCKQGLASCFVFDPYSLAKVSRLYFEIPVDEETVHGIPFRSIRYEIFLGFQSSAWYYVYLFLGNNHETILGEEIEVTDDEIIFNYYLKDGEPVEEPRLKPTYLDLLEVSIKADQGMVVSHIKGRSSKLTIFKYDKPVKTVASFFGYIQKLTLGSLLKIPLGRHKITACGIICDFDE